MALFSARIFSNILVSSAMVFSCASAYAEVVFFNFTGTVQSSNGSVNGLGDIAPGSLIQGSFSYDVNAAPVRIGPDYLGYSASSPSHIAVRYGSHQARANALDITGLTNPEFSSLYRLDMGTPTASVVQIDHQAAPDIYIALSLVTEWGSNDVALNLPRSFARFDFERTDFSSAGLIANGSNSSYLAFSVDSITTAVPEPETYAMLGLGLLALLMQGRRKV